MNIKYVRHNDIKCIIDSKEIEEEEWLNHFEKQCDGKSTPGTEKAIYIATKEANQDRETSICLELMVKAIKNLEK